MASSGFNKRRASIRKAMNRPAANQPNFARGGNNNIRNLLARR